MAHRAYLRSDAERRRFVGAIEADGGAGGTEACVGGLERLVGGINLRFKGVELRVVEALPPLGAQSLVAGLSGLPAVGWLKGGGAGFLELRRHSGGGRAAVVGADNTASAEQQGGEHEASRKNDSRATRITRPSTPASNDARRGPRPSTPASNDARRGPRPFDRAERVRHPDWRLGRSGHCADPLPATEPISTGMPLMSESDGSRMT